MPLRVGDRDVDLLTVTTPFSTHLTRLAAATEAVIRDGFTSMELEPGFVLHATNLTAEQVITAEDAQAMIDYNPPKNGERRSVAVPAFLRDVLARHLAEKVASEEDAFVFTTESGSPLRNPNFHREVWYKAVAAVGLPDGFRIHDLRHTCAAMLIADGRMPKTVQTHLGHSGIQVTMDRYGHLYPDEMERVAEGLDAVYRRSVASASRGKPVQRAARLANAGQTRDDGGQTPSALSA